MADSPLREQLQALVENHGAQAVQEALQDVLTSGTTPDAGPGDGSETHQGGSETHQKHHHHKKKHHHHSKETDKEGADTKDDEDKHKHHHSSSKHHHHSSSSKKSASSSAAERLNRSILDSSPDAIVVADAEGNMVQVNQAMLTIFGFDTEAQVLGQNIEVLVGKHAEMHRAYMKSFWERGGTSTLLGSKRRLVARRRDGTEFPVRIGIRRVADNSDGSASSLVVGFIQDVSQEERAEQEERLNRSILDSSPDAIIVADEVGNIMQVNKAMLEIFGFETEAEVVGTNIELLVGEHADRHRSYMKNFWERGKVSSVLGKNRRLVARRRDGTEFPVRIGLRLVEGIAVEEGEKKDMVVGFIQDVSQEERAEQEERLNRSILDSSPDAIVVADEEGNMIQVNKAMLDIFGFDDEADAVGKNIEVLVGDHADRHRSYMKNFWERGKVSTVLGKHRRLVARRQDGTEFPVRIGLRLVPGMTDKKMVVGFIQDISSEARAEREEQLNTSILDSSPDAIVVADEEGNVLQVNKAMLDIFGFKDEADALGRNIEILVGGQEHAEHHRSYMKHFKERGGTSTVLGKNRRLVAKRQDGTEFPVRISIRKVGAQGLIVGFIQDITHETRAMELAVEKRAAEELLFNMLPQEIAQRLKEDPSHIADHFTKATVLFADIVGFTKMSNTLKPIEVVKFLNSIFSRFDDKLDKYGLNKVKTIGDCYMVTSIPGCQDPPRSCAAVCHFAMDMIHALSDYNKENPDTPLNMRIGVNCGPVVAGVVGTKRFLYDIWGDAVNIASRMESTGIPGKVQVTKEVIDVIPSDEFSNEKRGTVQVKGIGEMETYFITERDTRQAKNYWKTIRTSVFTQDVRRSSRILELLQDVKQLESSLSSLPPIDARVDEGDGNQLRPAPSREADEQQIPAEEAIGA